MLDQKFYVQSLLVVVLAHSHQIIALVFVGKIVTNLKQLILIDPHCWEVVVEPSWEAYASQLDYCSRTYCGYLLDHTLNILALDMTSEYYLNRKDPRMHLSFFVYLAFQAVFFFGAGIGFT